MENLKKDGIKYLLTKLKDYFLQIKDAVLTVNSETPDSNGNIEINRVDTAGNLETSFKQNSTGTFQIRTSGGSAAVTNGNATLSAVYGNIVRDGYTPESIQVNVTPVDEDEPISAKMTDRDTFIENVTESTTITLTYTTDWSEDPSSYGITVTGTPASGDKIEIVYVKEVRGVIYTTAPETFVSTGWNLFNSSLGYARVVKYSDEYGYKIDGAYTGIAFSTTPSGTQTPISPSSTGLFSIPGDGYVFVTGGNATTTAIYPTWSDWVTGYPGSFEAYTVTQISLDSIVSTYFPYGLCAVDNVRDEINISAGYAYRRIDRMEYTDANLATVKSSGLGYIYDEEYIYAVRSIPVQTQISSMISGGYTVNDHGLEMFTDTMIPAMALTVYSMNLKNKLERDTVTISQQTLSSADQAQIRKNIGASGATEMATKMNYDDPLFLIKQYTYKTGSISANSEKSYTATNLGITDVAGYKPIGILQISTGKAGVFARNYTVNSINADTTVIVLRNITGSSVSGCNIGITVAYVKDTLIMQEE